MGIFCSSIMTGDIEKKMVSQDLSFIFTPEEKKIVRIRKFVQSISYS